MTTTHNHRCRYYSCTEPATTWANNSHVVCANHLDIVNANLARETREAAQRHGTPQ